jgi:hypothetical protein
MNEWMDEGGGGQTQGAFKSNLFPCMRAPCMWEPFWPNQSIFHNLKVGRPKEYRKVRRNPFISSSLEIDGSNFSIISNHCRVTREAPKNPRNFIAAVLEEFITVLDVPGGLLDVIGRDP